MFRKSLLVTTLVASLAGNTAAFAGPEAEVLHWWTPVEKLNQSQSFKRNFLKMVVNGQICLLRVVAVMLL